MRLSKLLQCDNSKLSSIFFFFVVCPSKKKLVFEKHQRKTKKRKEKKKEQTKFRIWSVKYYLYDALMSCASYCNIDGIVRCVDSSCIGGRTWRMP